MLKYISLKKEHAKLILRWRMMPRVTKYMLTNVEEDFEKHKRWLNDVINKKNCKYWVISYGGKEIGLVNLSKIDIINKRCTMGYYIGETEFTGLGALFLPPVYNYVFNKLNLIKIYGEVMDGNDLILGIHKYHGWRNVGTFKNHIYKNDKYYDVHLLELLASDWFSKWSNKTSQLINSINKYDELFE